ncbi:hypothetical protein CLV46_1103 [Diaminobutyricimonas aerilata]|uniref:Uncharacterized protein n=1 Tax=Diaminobutyricimonas aerilata TaxID=1162967 RepID=A0A2M9CI11_9MICO|nr:hypothetical protein [Diaminobutyricimonas aerilata]PJJ71554.1 hypothetical protein CLV46_1103 [Diaminobutyricimonas aerilata]
MTDTITPAAPTTAPPRVPSVHVRALITWSAIFPLVTLGLAALTPLMEQWPLVLRSLVLTAIVVPLAVYLVVPAFMRAWMRLSARR